ncbi:unnamed protein product [Schistosoma curassoni]|uniref:Transmembrane protein n=1 Tax=Schistosoma curassoni TaxID=6186 RepID=A0A183KIW7_9TREM|nr:unnamed protein product [Schistosoma curassoni]
MQLPFTPPPIYLFILAGSLSSSSSIVNVPTVSSFNMIGPNALTRYHFLITLNSIEASQKDLLSLVNHLESELNLLYQNQEINSQKLNMCITELKVSISDQLQALLDSAFEYLSTSVIQSQVKTLLNVFKSLKYDLIEEDLDVFAANDRWIESCIAHTEDFLKPFRVFKFHIVVITFFYNYVISITVVIEFG